MDSLSGWETLTIIQEDAQKLFPLNECGHSCEYLSSYAEPVEEAKAQGPTAMLDDENEDITYQQKLKFS